MAIKSGITLTETDPANIDTPSTGKITIFQDATMSPPQPAYKSEDGSVSSLVGPPGPEGPAGPTGSITVNPNGALDGDGSGGSPLGVRVDGVTIGINASNELEAVGGGSGTVVNDVALTAGATVVGAGGAHVVVDTVTSDLVDRTAGVLGSVSVGSGLQKSAGTLSANVDNETIGTDSNGKLQVIANYILKGVVRLGLHFVNGWLDVNVDNETIGIDSHNKLQVIQPYAVTVGGVVPGLIGGGLVLLANSTVITDTASFDFLSIPATYKHLLIVLQGQSTVASTSDNVLMRFNNDSGSNYDYCQGAYGSGASFAASTAEAYGTTSIARTATVPGATSSAGDVGNAAIYIPSYAQTTFNKSAYISGGGMLARSAGNARWVQAFGSWRSTAAINRVTLTMTSGNWKAGSIATLYGMN